MKKYSEDIMGQPCIRGLKQFEDTGCPGPWDEKSKTGCPACIEGDFEELQDGNKSKKTMRTCIDMWAFYFNFWQQSRLSGIQNAVISLRNSTCEPNPNDPLNDNSARPKAPAETALMAQALNKVVELVVKGNTLSTKLQLEKMASKIEAIEATQSKQIEHKED